MAKIAVIIVCSVTVILFTIMTLAAFNVVVNNIFRDIGQQSIIISSIFFGFVGVFVIYLIIRDHQQRKYEHEQELIRLAFRKDHDE